MTKDNFCQSGKNWASSQFSVITHINKIVSPRLQDKFVKKVFNDDQKDYEKFISLINNINNWKDANILINFYFYKNGVDPTSREAVELRSVIYHLYSSREK